MAKNNEPPTPIRAPGFGEAELRIMLARAEEETRVLEQHGETLGELRGEVAALIEKEKAGAPTYLGQLSSIVDRELAIHADHMKRGAAVMGEQLESLRAALSGSLAGRAALAARGALPVEGAQVVPLRPGLAPGQAAALGEALVPRLYEKPHVGGHIGAAIDACGAAIEHLRASYFDDVDAGEQRALESAVGQLDQVEDLLRQTFPG